MKGINFILVKINYMFRLKNWWSNEKNIDYWLKWNAWTEFM